MPTPERSTNHMRHVLQIGRKPEFTSIPGATSQPPFPALAAKDDGVRLLTQAAIEKGSNCVKAPDKLGVAAPCLHHLAETETVHKTVPLNVP